jgi:hypothetical protein
MATTRNKVRKQLQSALKRSGIEGAYSQLIREAIINDWSDQQFVQALVRTKSFRRNYPGLVRGGHINDFLLGQEGAPLSFSSLGQALGNYRTLWQQYETAGRAYGYGKLSKRQVAALIQGEKSPDEFMAAAEAVQLVKTNEGALSLYNQQRKAAGLQPMKQRELFESFASRNRGFVDAYEATRLRLFGGNLGLSAEGAQQVAASLGTPGTITGSGDIGQLISDLRGQLGDIGPELEREGISRVQLAQFLANPDVDKLGISQRIAQLQQRRRSQGQFAAGQQAGPRPGSTGGTPGPTAYG